MQLDGRDIHAQKAVFIHAAIPDVLESGNKLGGGIPRILHAQCLSGKHHARCTIAEDAGVVAIDNLLFGVASLADRGKHFPDPRRIILFDGFKTRDLLILLD